MTAVKIYDHCPGCGVCTRPNVCPTDAISIVGGKAVINDKCISCGLCIPVCPIGIIVEVETEDTAPKAEQLSQPLVTASGEEEQHGETSSGT